MAFIIDASIAIVWFLPDEVSPIADSALKRLDGDTGIVPDLFWHEMRNVLLNAYRRQRLPRGDVAHSMFRLGQLDISTPTTSSDDNLILTLAERHGLTAYDAAYLALAIELKLPLATLDKQLIAASGQEGVPLVV